MRNTRQKGIIHAGLGTTSTAQGQAAVPEATAGAGKSERDTPRQLRGLWPRASGGTRHS